MLVVPENKMTRLLHLLHYTDVNATLIYTNANKVYQFTEFQKNSDVIIMTNIIIQYISTVNKSWFSSSVRQQFYLPDVSTHDTMPTHAIYMYFSPILPTHLNNKTQSVILNKTTILITLTNMLFELHKEIKKSVRSSNKLLIILLIALDR